MLRNKFLALAAVVAGAALSAQAAHAQIGISVGVGRPYYGAGFYGRGVGVSVGLPIARPYYYSNYYAPRAYAPAYIAPVQAYVAPAPVAYYAPIGYAAPVATTYRRCW